MIVSALRRRGAQRAAVLLAALPLFAGCSALDESLEEPSGASASSQASPTPSQETSDGDSALALDPFIDHLQRYWSEHAAAAGLTYKALPAARIQPLNGKPVTCDGEPVDETDIEDNAIALSCEEGPAVMWDPALIDDLTQTFGPAAPAMVFAHEWGHVLDDLSKLGFEGVQAEQFADCMAGAFTSAAVADKIAPYTSRSALDATVGAAVEFSDPPGTDAADDDAHGLGFDRVRALQEGYDLGARKCLDYQDSAPPLTETTFAADEKKNSGNLAYDEAYPLEVAAVQEFLTAEALPFKTRPTSVEVTSKSDAELRTLHKQIGDSAPLAVMLVDTAAAAQADEGRDPSADGEQLQQACLAGAFLGWAAQQQASELSLSAGDVDEVLIALTMLGVSDEPGFVFEQTASMRTGFTDGTASCRTR